VVVPGSSPGGITRTSSEQVSHLKIRAPRIVFGRLADEHFAIAGDHGEMILDGVLGLGIDDAGFAAVLVVHVRFRS